MPANTGHVRGAALSLCRKAEQEVLGSGPCLQFREAANRKVLAENQANAVGLLFIDDELAVLDVVTERDGTAHPHALASRGRELVADALARQLPYAQLRKQFFVTLERIENSSSTPQTDAIERFAHDETLDELVSAIERDIGANRPAAALDRLHTYCMKKFAHLLDARGIAWDRNEPLHSRVGKYVKAVSQERQLREVSAQIVKNAIAVFEKFNHVRNNQSLGPHARLVGKAEPYAAVIPLVDDRPPPQPSRPPGNARRSAGA